MEVRSVITAILTHQGKILIVRRSSKVGSFQGRWSGISGYLVGDPLAHALVEISEETSLAKTDLTLLRAPPHLDIADPNRPLIWRVHPFLFEVHAPEKITLDWENDAACWIAPSEITDFPTVPALELVVSTLLG